MNHSLSRTPDHGARVLTRIAPGLTALRAYRREWFRADLVAGVSVAAIAIPTAVAYAQIAGFSPIVGLYAAILPLVVYALFGTSRHLIVNPDAAACALVAAVCTPIAGADPALRIGVSMVLALIVGLMCIAGGLFHLGFIADFLSRPILLGLLNGVAITIFLAQIGPLLGFTVDADGVLPRLAEIWAGLHQTHWPTAALSAACIAVLILSRRFLRRAPGPLIVMLGAGLAVALLHLDERGVAVVGKVSRDLPAFRFPILDARTTAEIFGGAFGLTLVVFSKGMLHARTFANRHHYEIDADKELIAIGAANIAAGLSRAFVVGGADSRTVVADVMGGKSQATGLVAAALIAATLAFLTGPLAYLPGSALAAVLAVAAFTLFDWRSLARLVHVSRGEFGLSVVTSLGVAGLGVLPGIGFAITLAILRLLALSRRPHDAILGRVPGMAGFHNVEDFADARTIAGLVLYRFESGVLFYNAPYFKERALHAARSPTVKWVLLDASAIPAIDATGAETIEELRADLEARGVTLAIATARHKVRKMLERAGTLQRMGPSQVHPTIKSAVRAYYGATGDADVAHLGINPKKARAAGEPDEASLHPAL